MNSSGDDKCLNSYTRNQEVRAADEIQYNERAGEYSWMKCSDE